jgi:hypothetical protein
VTSRLTSLYFNTYRLTTCPEATGSAASEADLRGFQRDLQADLHILYYLQVDVVS